MTFSFQAAILVTVLVSVAAARAQEGDGISGGAQDFRPARVGQGGRTSIWRW